jgi:hypothetical protein
MTKYLEFHPISAPYPMIGGIPFTTLADGKPVAVNGDSNPVWREFVMSIRTKGLLQPIIKWGDKIIDGRNRYIACLEAGVEPAFRDVSDVAHRWAGLSADEKYKVAEDVVLHANTRREHYSNLKRALVVVPHYQDWLKESGDGRQRTLLQSVSPAAGETVEPTPHERACQYGGAGVTRKVLEKAARLYKYYGGNALNAIVEYNLSAEKMINLINRLDEHLNGDGGVDPTKGTGFEFARLVVASKEQDARLRLITWALYGARKDNEDKAERTKCLGVLTDDHVARATSSASTVASRLRALADNGIVMGDELDKLRELTAEINDLLEKVTP